MGYVAGRKKNPASNWPGGFPVLKVCTVFWPAPVVTLLAPPAGNVSQQGQVTGMLWHDSDFRYL